MATSLSGLFDGYVDPQQLREKQQQQFSQNLSQAVTPQAFIAQVGSNMGQQLGNFIPGMMGQKGYNEKIAAILKQVQGIEDPVEQARAAYQAFAQAGMPKEAQMMLDRLQEAKKEAADLAYKQAQTDALGQGKTANERLEKQLLSLEAKAVDNTLSEPEKRQARVLVEQAKKDRTYVDPETKQLITVKGFNAEAAVPNLMAALQGRPLPGAAIGGQAATMPGATSTSVTATPGSELIKQQWTAQQQGHIDKLNSDITNIDAAIGTIKKEGRWAGGVGSVLSFIPESAAKQLQTQLSTIDAANLIRTVEDMKTVSANGSTGFGALNQSEGEALKSRIRGLNQANKPDQTLKDLEYIKTMINKMIGRAEESLSSRTSKPEGGKDANAEALINKVIAFNQQKGKAVTRAQAIGALAASGKLPADYK